MPHKLRQLFKYIICILKYITNGKDTQVPQQEEEDRKA